MSEHDDIFGQFNLSDLMTDDTDSVIGKQNAPHLPQKQFRCLVSGASSCGKTSILFKLLLNGELHFDKLYLFARGASIGEAKYTFLIDFYTQIAEQAGVNIHDILVIGNEPNDIPEIESLDPTISNLVIFDDWIADKRLNETKILDYFIRGRKQNTSMFYLTQSYYTTPKNIRLNCNYMIVFKLNSRREINGLVSEVAGGVGIDYEAFKEAYLEAVSKKYGWVLIDFSTQQPNMKLRAGFKQYLNLDALIDAHRT